MSAASFLTTVGSTADVRASNSDVILAHEPDTGATLRTKGRLYLVCEIAGAGSPASAIPVAREIAELVEHEYYYDLSAGIEVSLRRALRQADRRAAQRMRERRSSSTFHLACIVVVNNEMYGARIGAAQVFIVRRARLFLPGDEPGELADFVHRTTTRDATSLGVEGDLVPKIWRQPIEAGDTVIIASGAVVDRLGAETLKNAAVTLHPRAAAEHIHNRAIADGLVGSDAAVFIEISASSGAAARVAPDPVEIREPQEVVIAESIRSRVDAVWRRRPRIDRAIRGATAPLADAATKSVAVGLELMPKRGVTLPKHPDSARERSRRQRRAVTTLAAILLIVVAGIGALAYRDYESTRAERDYALAVNTAEQSLESAHRLADRKPPDPQAARDRVQQAYDRITEAARYPRADRARLEALRADGAALIDRLDGVVVDLALVAPGAKPSQLVGNVNGLYAADPGSGRVWRIFGDPLQTGVVMQRGTKGVGSPSLVTWQSDVLYAIDDQRKLWRAEGDQVRDVTPPDKETWKSVTATAVFTSNFYVLDAASGQLWKHESGDGTSFDKAVGYLATPVAPNIATSLAIDGDVWIVTSTSEVLRFRRNPLATTASRVDFTPRWQGPALRPVAIQAVNGQAAMYLLDATGRAIVQMARDGRELLRISLPATLAPPSAFYVSETSRIAYTVHGSKIVATALDR